MNVRDLLLVTLICISGSSSFPHSQAPISFSYYTRPVAQFAGAIAGACLAKKIYYEPFRSFRQGHPIKQACTIKNALVFFVATLATAGSAGTIYASTKVGARINDKFYKWADKANNIRKEYASIIAAHEKISFSEKVLLASAFSFDLFVMTTTLN